MHKILFYNKFIIFLYMFRAPCTHHQEVKLYYTASGIITLCRWPSGAQVERRLYWDARSAKYQNFKKRVPAK